MSATRARGQGKVNRERAVLSCYVFVVSDRGHWVNWHDAYEDPTSSLSRRLAMVQLRLSHALDEAPAGPISLLSMCAGQGRDVIGVATSHERGREIRARLIEFDGELVEHARAAVSAAGLADIEVRQGDASITRAYEGAAPARIVLACGVFGNVSDRDIRQTISILPMLVANGGTTIWTRHRLEPDLTPSIRRWFDEAGFDEIGFDGEDGRSFGVGTYRLVGPTKEFDPDLVMFQFIGDGSGAMR